jgi:hypothetical protein
MSDANLLALGCSVSFIALAGFYVYLRECWTAEERPSQSRERPSEVEDEVHRNVV